MILHNRFRTNGSSPIGRVWAPALAAACLLLASCGDDPVETEEPLCAGEAGVGIRVEGRAQPLDVCVSDAAVDALLTSSQRYDVSARMTTDDGVYQLSMVFTRRSDFPVSLRVVDSITEVTNDPGAAYVYYKEVPDGGTPIESGSVLGGKFRLSFCDDKVAAGTMENITFEMSSVLNGDPAGQRKIVEGFFSISVEPPVASEVVVR
jgi:hypothetical protein